MRFTSLQVRNLRAVRQFEVSDLKDFIVIAGPNGSGKSCIFDAIRLLKSIYGGYSADEHIQWFGEFAINLQDRESLRRMFRDPTSPVEISATIQYSEAEQAFLINHSADLVWPIAWQRVTGQRLITGRSTEWRSQRSWPNFAKRRKTSPRDNRPVDVSAHDNE